MYPINYMLQHCSVHITHTCMHARRHTQTHRDTLLIFSFHTHSPTCMLSHVHTTHNTHTHTHTHTHTPIHTPTHTHTHTCAREHPCQHTQSYIPACACVQPMCDRPNVGFRPSALVSMLEKVPCPQNTGSPCGASCQ